MRTTVGAKSPFVPRIVLKVFNYAYLKGVFSSGKIARKLDKGVASRRLAISSSTARSAISER